MVVNLNARGRSASALISLLACVSSHASSEPLAEGLRRCSLESDAHQRLSCFDGLVGTLPKIESDQFGMTSPLAHKRDPSNALDAHSNEVLDARISNLQEVASGQWVFALDNDQLWIAVDPKPGMNFKVNESIQITHGAMGSLWLGADHHRRIRVKRIR